MCKLHGVATSRSNMRRWMLVPGPHDLQQLALCGGGGGVVVADV